MHKLRGLHPCGWVALGIMALAAFFHLVADTGYLIGNLAWWHWLLLVATVLLSAWTDGLHRLRLGIESLSSVTRPIAWMLAWAVFMLQFFNVITRYGNDLVEADILFAETTSLAWQSFGLMCLVGINYGVRDGVNPRIDFWWANFSNRTKAALDFCVHTLLLLPFIVMSVRILNGYAATSLGRRRNGEWPSGWRVWETWEEAIDAGGLAVGPIKVMILVAFVLFGLQVIAEMIKTGFVLIGRENLGGIVARDTPLRIE